jgi:hypothetical protein
MRITDGKKSKSKKTAKRRRRLNKAEARYKAYMVAKTHFVPEPPVHEDRDLTGREARVYVEPAPELDAPDDELEEGRGTRGGSGALFGELADGEELPDREGVRRRLRTG